MLTVRFATAFALCLLLLPLTANAAPKKKVAAPVAKPPAAAPVVVTTPVGAPAAPTVNGPRVIALDGGKGASDRVVLQCDPSELPLFMVGNTYETINGKVYHYPEGISKCQRRTSPATPVTEPESLKSGAVTFRNFSLTNCPADTTPLMLVLGTEKLDVVIDDGRLNIVPHTATPVAGDSKVAYSLVSGALLTCYSTRAPA